MAVTKTIIQNSSTRSVVKITGTAAADTSTITLANIAYVNELGATVTPTKVNITKVTFSCASTGDITVVRNAATILKLFGSGKMHEFGLAEENGSSVVVTFNTTAGGTIVLELAKIQ